MFQMSSFMREARNAGRLTAQEEGDLRRLHRVLMHVTNVDLPEMRRATRVTPMLNVDLRLKYLLNQIDQREWRVKLQQREKKREKTHAVLQVYDMFCAAAADMLRAMADKAATPRDTVDHLRQLQAFANESLDAIAKRFNMSVKRLRADP